MIYTNVWSACAETEIFLDEKCISKNKIHNVTPSENSMLQFVIENSREGDYIIFKPGNHNIVIDSKNYPKSGSAITIKNKKKLTLIGEGNVWIRTQEGTVSILAIHSSQDITIKNIGMIHDLETGWCGAPAIQMENSKNIKILDSYMHGSGTEAVTMEGVDGVEIVGGSAMGNTEGVFDIRNSFHIKIKHIAITGNKFIGYANGILNIRNSKNISMVANLIADNTNKYFKKVEKSQNVLIKGNIFKNNFFSNESSENETVSHCSGLYKGKKISEEQLENILADHYRWLKSGKRQYNHGRADLCGADLSGLNLQGANLSYAILNRANLSQSILISKIGFPPTTLEGANLQGANLTQANLYGAILENADLTSANLHKANLAYSKCKHAIFSGANLEEANLEGAFMEEASLINANLQKANLLGAHLRNASLMKADMKNAHINYAVMDNANFFRADLSDIEAVHTKFNKAKLTEAILKRAKLNLAEMNYTKLDKANLRDAMLEKAKIKNAFLYHADLSKANLSNSKLDGSILDEAILINANLTEASLKNASLINTKLEGSFFSGTVLTNSIFRPNVNSLPNIISFASTIGFLNVKFSAASSSDFSNYGTFALLTTLREEFKNAGLREKEREVTYIFKTEEHRLNSDKSWFMQIGNAIMWFAFNLTCKYGLKPFRPLLILFIFGVIFPIPYWFALRINKGRIDKAGIMKILPSTHFDTELITYDGSSIRKEMIKPINAFNKRQKLKREFNFIIISLYFSLSSAFHIGWRDLNIGNWLGRLQFYEFSLQGTGWVRTLSGLQSMLSVYLVALTILSYFGRPFEW